MPLVIRTITNRLMLTLDEAQWLLEVLPDAIAEATRIVEEKKP
jgi:hypothetical protein